MIHRTRKTDLTPLAFDCGRLCGSHCCQGGADAGMRLFPGETADSGFTVRDTADGGRLLLCGGHCDRRVRPLACRIFPLFPISAMTDGSAPDSIRARLRSARSSAPA